MLCIVPVCKTSNIRSHNQRPSILRHHTITHRTATGFCCVLVLGNIGVFLVICGICSIWYTVHPHEEHAVFCVHSTFQCRPLTSESTTWGSAFTKWNSIIQCRYMYSTCEPVSRWHRKQSPCVWWQSPSVPSDHRSKEKQLIAGQCCQTGFFI